MNYLVDTNAWISFFEGQAGFGRKAKTIMSTHPSQCFISLAGVWEAAIKIGLGKLVLPYDLSSDLPDLIRGNGFQIIGIDWDDVVLAQKLERHHGDPFDRLQIIQARRRGWKVISRDPVFEKYDVSRIW